MLVVIILAMTAANLPAQLHTLLHCFNNSPDGTQPFGDLVLGGNLFTEPPPGAAPMAMELCFSSTPMAAVSW